MKTEVSKNSHKRQVELLGQHLPHGRWRGKRHLLSRALAAAAALHAHGESVAWIDIEKLAHAVNVRGAVVRVYANVVAGHVAEVCVWGGDQKDI